MGLYTVLVRTRLSTVLLLSAVAGWSSGAVAQAAPTASERVAQQPPGYAIGHVTCNDTQRPARIASVRFIPVPTAARAVADRGAPQSKIPAIQTDSELGEAVSPVETDMEGNFTARNLKPGRYFVRVDLGGYLSPLLGFTPKELAQPDEATQQRIARELQIVDIRAQAESRVDVTLQRGATISGTVHFDDGSPAINLSAQLLVKNAKGEWEGARLGNSGFGSTDARGHFELAAVPPGDYLVRIGLSLNEHSYMVMPMNGDEVHVDMTKTVFSLPVYSGSALRQREATAIKVEGASSYDGNDISLPISKLHHISGAVVASDGHPLNGGKVILRYADDNTELASVDVNREEKQFSFPYVPEGSFTLAVEEARDVTEIEVPNAPGVSPKMRLEQKTVRSYGKVEQPLIVQSDVEGVLATVPEPSHGSTTSKGSN